MSVVFRSSLTLMTCAAVTPVHAAPPVAKAQGADMLKAGAATDTGEVLTAQSIPSLPGFVRSPYTKPPQLVNVKGMAPGSKVICPYTQRPFILPSDVKDEPNVPARSEPGVAALKPESAPSGKSVKDAAVVLPVKDTSWHVTIGPQWRQIGSVDWRTGSLASKWSLPWLVGRRGSNQAGIPEGVGDHQYDDGFVNVDSGGQGSSSTWYWGYNSASQLQGNDLVFNAANAAPSTFRSSSWSSLRQSAWSDDLEGAGVFAKLESPELVRFGGVGVSLDLAYSWARDESSNVTRDVFHAEQSSTATGGGSITDRYDVTGVFVPLAPFEGTFAGPGPVIPNAPYSRTVSGGGTGVTERAIFSSDVRESFEVNLHTLSFGPRFSMDCCKDVRLGVGLGLALNIADWDAQYEETLTVRRNGGSERVLKRWREGQSGTDVLPGFYIEAIAQIRLTERLSAYLSGRYDWSDSLSEEIGPSSFEFEPGGWSVMAGLTVSL